MMTRALGMFEVFGRTGPPILGGRQFCQTQVVDECNAMLCMFVPSDSVVRHLVVLDILTNTHNYWLITYVQYCTVYESMWRSGLRSKPHWGAYSVLQSPDPPP